MKTFLLRTSAFAAVVLVALGAPKAPAAEWVWEREVGWIDLDERPPKSDRGLYAYGKGLCVRGDYAAAAEVFKQVEQEFPESAYAVRARLSRARCLAKLRRFDEAVVICKAFLAEPTEEFTSEEIYEIIIASMEPLAREDPETVLKVVPSVLEDAPTPRLRFRAHSAIADAQFERKEYEQARQAYEEAAEALPDHDDQYEALFNAGLCDVISCREWGQDEQTLRRAADRFHKVRNATTTKSRARAAQQYLWVIDNLEREADPERRAVFYAVTYLREQRYDDALPIFKRAQKKYRNTLLGETAHFHRAETYYMTGKYWTSFKSYELFFEDYPRTLRRKHVMRQEFRIAKALGRRKQFGRAVTVLETLVKNRPSSELADDALMEIGRYHLEDARYSEARAAFQAVARDYPKSEWHNVAIFHSGLADLQLSDAAGDADARVESARSAFEVYLQNEPEGRFAARAQALLIECDDRQARAMWEIAQFYKRRKQPQAAAWYCGLIVRDYPEVESAKRAKSALRGYRKRGYRLP